VTAEQLAAALDLDVYEVGICHACLCFVSFPLDAGDEREVARAVREFAPILWEDGLALPLQAALERARRHGVAGAAAAIADVERSGPRAPIVSAVIRTLAADLTRRTREALEREGVLAPPAPVLELPEQIDGRSPL
jgi:hypothetical protein